MNKNIFNNAGPKGDKGDKGDIGPQGVKGDTGNTTSQIASSNPTAGQILAYNPGSSKYVNASFPRQNLYVSSNGDDSLGTGSILYPYKTISAALSSIVVDTTGNNNTQIIISSGIYNENIVLKPFVTLFGAQPPTHGPTSTNSVGINGTITVDPTYSTTSASYALSNLYLLKNCTLDFSTFTAGQFTTIQSCWFSVAIMYTLKSCAASNHYVKETFFQYGVDVSGPGLFYEMNCYHANSISTKFSIGDLSGQTYTLNANIYNSTIQNSVNVIATTANQKLNLSLYNTVCLNGLSLNGAQITAVTNFVPSSVSISNSAVYSVRPVMAFSGLQDLTLATVADGDSLYYNSTTSKWNNIPSAYLASVNNTAQTVGGSSVNLTLGTFLTNKGFTTSSNQILCNVTGTYTMSFTVVSAMINSASTIGFGVANSTPPTIISAPLAAGQTITLSTVFKATAGAFYAITVATGNTPTINHCSLSLARIAN